MTHNWNLKHDPAAAVMLEDIKLLRDALLTVSGRCTPEVQIIVDKALLATEKYEVE